MTASTLETASHALTAWDAATTAETGYPDPTFVAAILDRTGRGDYPQWLDHITAAAACSRPVRLRGEIYDIVKAGDRATIVGVGHTETMPDGVIYKACGNRRASVCPACSKTYQRDAYQIIKAGLVGGKGIPEHVATHPAVFATLTAPSFGPVHARIVKHHVCAQKRDCDCRPEPCHARRSQPRCAHGRPRFCFERHKRADKPVGKPICLDCYDHDAHVVWNRYAGELWRRTKQAIGRHLAKLAKQRGIPWVVVGVNPHTGRLVTKPPVRVTCGKVAEFQARGIVHFHVLLRLDGLDGNDSGTIIPPPVGFTHTDLHEAVTAAAQQIRFVTPEHADQPHGWLIEWGTQIDLRSVAMSGNGDINDGQVAGYLAKYATKSTEPAGLRSNRLAEGDIHEVANFGGNHIERLLAACWKLGRRITPSRDDSPPPSPDNPAYFQGLQRWAHMIGFGGHFFTQSRRYSVTFTHQRAARVAYRRRQIQPRDLDRAGEETTVVISTLTFAGIGWHTSADAMLANTAAAMARDQEQVGREENPYRYPNND